MVSRLFLFQYSNINAMSNYKLNRSCLSHIQLHHTQYRQFRLPRNKIQGWMFKSMFGFDIENQKINNMEEALNRIKLLEMKIKELENQQMDNEDLEGVDIDIEIDRRMVVIGLLSIFGLTVYGLARFIMDCSSLMNKTSNKLTEHVDLMSI
eukprot:454954_1